MAKNLIKIQADKEAVEIRVSPFNMVFNSLVSGLAWDLETALRATVAFAVVIYFLGKLNTAPVIGHYISDILNYVSQAKVK